MALTMAAVMLAALASSNKSVCAFIPSSGRSSKKHYSAGQQNPSPFQQSRSGEPPMVPHLPSSSEDAEAKQEGDNKVWDSPYDHLFRTQLQQQQQGISKKNASSTEYPNKKHVHIILFKKGLPGEGVHTIEYPKHSGSNIILAFQSYQDCQRFAKKLGSQMDSIPVPQQIVTNNLKTYADALGMAVQVIPTGMTLKPPDRSEVGGVGLGDQVPVLMKLKEKKSCLDRLIGTSPSSSSGNGEYGPAWG